jgi:UDP-N-acetyl-D-glucosamine dehydrogenase
LVGGNGTVTGDTLSLAINGRERKLSGDLIAYRPPAGHNGNGNGHGAGIGTAAILGLGYVGLPTALALYGRCPRILGIDISEERLGVIAARDADLADNDRLVLDAALSSGVLELTSDIGALSAADTVIICVPTPVDESYVPDLTALRGACASVVAVARPGQTIILTSTSYVGTTQELLTEPLAARGLRAGQDVFVAFSPERIDPGNPEHEHRETPRVAGGVTAACAERAAAVVGLLTGQVHVLSSPEAAEATKLYENIFRAVSLALANEFADACTVLGLDPIEITLAAGTKPYGFLGVFPGPGVGGHCIPCDPYYLLWQLGKRGRRSPLIEQAMRSIALRPAQVVDRAAEMAAGSGLAAGGQAGAKVIAGGLAGAKVIVVGISYKSGVADVRESPAIPIIGGLVARGAVVSIYDPLVPVLRLPSGQEMRTVKAPRGEDFDLAIVHTMHPGVSYGWVAACKQVLDGTYRFDAAPHREVV